MGDSLQAKQIFNKMPYTTLLTNVFINHLQKKMLNIFILTWLITYSFMHKQEQQQQQQQQEKPPADVCYH